MSLSKKIIARISVILLVLMAIWATLFYSIIVEEINDETDDSLEDYSEYIIKRVLAGEKLPETDNGTNNSYHITEVSAEYASNTQRIRYYDETVYIKALKENEPARVLKTIFSDRKSHFYELRVAVPTIEKEDLLEAILIWIIILYCGLLLVIIIVNWWVLRQSFRPLYILLDWLDHFDVDKRITTPIVKTKIVEFKKLNDSITKSALRNIETYERQKTFIGEVSHELQTPLAICRNRLELALNKPDLGEQQLGELFKIKESIDGLILLNKSLLLLTKIENNLFLDTGLTNINELIKNILEPYSDIYTQYDIKVNVKEEAVLKININSELGYILFGNLLKNAFVHNKEKGVIAITISEKEVSICNTGEDHPLNTQKIFERFYHKSKTKKSTGLGLSIVKSICDNYRMSIKYSFENNLHKFSVHL
jgi:Signal transduction histidine kinase